MDIIDFIKHDLKKECDEILKNIKDEKEKETFKKCFLNTIDTTVSYYKNNDAFLITGDIPAMWLRDSSCQVIHYLPFIKENPFIRHFIGALINKQMTFITKDAYTNAFKEEDVISQWASDETKMSSFTWERKFELDSLCFPIKLSCTYLELTNDYFLCDNTFYEALKTIVLTFYKEQDHLNRSDYSFRRVKKNGTVKDTSVLNNNLNSKCGLIYSAFRPSDDIQTYAYNIPENFFVLSTLKDIKQILLDVYHDNEYAKLIDEISINLSEALLKYGIVNINGKDIYVYETNGSGDYLLMDDANIPSLLSLPLICNDCIDFDIYNNTKEYILSKNNPYYYEGKYLKGIGSPHTKENYVWPISLCVEGLLENDLDKIKKIIDILVDTTANTFLMHESINVDNPNEYSRDWFAWANAMFSILVMKYYNIVS